MLEKTRSVLFIGCHMDDIEFGCGGIISKFSCTDIPLTLAVLSASNKDSNGNVILQRNTDECYAAISKLGLKKQRLYIGNCFGQIFDLEQQRVREELLYLKKRFDPDTVFFPSKNDIHQDHRALSENAFRIFRNNSCFGYEVIRSSHDFFPQVYEEISEDNLEKKISSVMCYQTQKQESAAYYFDESLIRSTAVFRGGQTGIRYAEAFECYRLIYRLSI